MGRPELQPDGVIGVRVERLARDIPDEAPAAAQSASFLRLPEVGSPTQHWTRVELSKKGASVCAQERISSPADPSGDGALTRVRHISYGFHPDCGRASVLGPFTVPVTASLSAADIRSTAASPAAPSCALIAVPAKASRPPRPAPIPTHCWARSPNCGYAASAGSRRSA